DVAGIILKGPRAIEGLSLLRPFAFPPFPCYSVSVADGPSLSIVIPVSAGSGARMTAARWTLAALAALLVLAYVPLSPAYPSNPNRDAGLFLYAGSEILHGGVPYRDVWDHKPPLIFYLNALGLALAPGWWGVWILELMMMGGALYASWRILHGFGALPAAVGCAVWICGVFVCSIAGRGGDLTENYALPLQFAAILLWSTGAVAAPRAAVLLGLLCA